MQIFIMIAVVLRIVPICIKDFDLPILAKVYSIGTIVAPRTVARPVNRLATALYNKGDTSSVWSL